MKAIEAIEVAIRGLRILELTYTRSTRTVEPHLLGINTKGNVVLSGYQISGGSGVGFRAFILDKIDAVVVTQENFSGARPGYNVSDPTIQKLLVHL